MAVLRWKSRLLALGKAKSTGTIMAQAKKAAPDWERIEADYRAGVRTLRDIASEHGITHAGVMKRAKRDGWARAECPAESRAVVLAPKDEMDASGFVYVIFIDTGAERFYKIGLAKSFGSRFDQHQTSSPFEIRVACCYFVGHMRAEERRLHERFAASRVRGEWFKLSTGDLREIAAGSLLV
jgi:hypothetical protein